MSPHEIFLRLSVAALLGSVVGLERHRSDKAAGMRTHMLVSLGAALFTIVSVHGFDREIRTMRLPLDPSRIAAQVVSGIGFLGAGTILRRNGTVLGLTTAASIWAVAAVGLATGCGLYVAAVATTILMLVVLAVVKRIEDAFAGGGGHHTLTLRIAQGPASPLPQVETLVQQAHLELRSIRVRQGTAPNESELTLLLARNRHDKLLTLISQLQTLPGIKGLEYDLGSSA
jgi:putative Mg2+ transporter-C (MgtC) family protein